MGLGTVWGPLIAWYLFLAGMGAGAYLVAILASSLGDKYQSLVKPGVWLGAPLVAIGSGLLLLDLGNPLRFYMGFFRPQSSMISVGIVIITVFILLGLVHLAALVLPAVKLSPATLRTLGWINAIFALGTALYTGLLLGVVKAVPFWNTPILPLLFLVSALSTGLGAVLVVLALRRWLAPGAREEAEGVTASAHLVSRVDLPLVIVELIVLFCLLFVMGGSPTVAAESARYLVAGGFAVAFWLGIVGIGLVVPLVLEAWSLKQQGVGLAALAGVCLLVGGILLRYAVLSAGASVVTTLG